MIYSLSWDDINAGLGQSWISGFGVKVIDGNIVNSDSDLFYSLWLY